MSQLSMECEEQGRDPEKLRLLGRVLRDHQQRLRRLSRHYALLGGETRLKILVLLARVGEICVCDLAKVLEMTPAAVSQHLSRLRSGGLVTSRRDGMTIFYRISDNHAALEGLPALELPDLGKE